MPVCIPHRAAALAAALLALPLAWAQSVAPAASAASTAPVASATSATERAPALDLQETVLRTQVTVKNLYRREETRPLPITMYRPAGAGPYPLVVFNHGRAVPAQRAAQGRFRPEAAARYLVAKGFVVLVPMRVGYWETYGDFDPEDAGPCNNTRLEAAAQAMVDQVLATVEFAKTLPYVDASRWIVAGQSAGGAAAVATVGRAPAGLLGGINFSGGTGGNPDTSPGRPCSPQAYERLWGRLAATAKAPMLWLYWPNDLYWGADHPRTWHQAWLAGGGQAQMPSLAAVGQDGHRGWAIDMDHWLAHVDGFLAQLGFTADARIQRPPPSGFAELADVASVPVKAEYLAAYQRFLTQKTPRAFAISERGGYGSGSGDHALGHALGNCTRFGARCRLYAVDHDVVWREK